MDYEVIEKKRPRASAPSLKEIDRFVGSLKVMNGGTLRAAIC
jgi:hypothetical protein